MEINYDQGQIDVNNINSLVEELESEIFEEIEQKLTVIFKKNIQNTEILKIRQEQIIENELILNDSASAIVNISNLEIIFGDEKFDDKKAYLAGKVDSSLQKFCVVGNLKNLLTTIGNINEYILKIITKQLVSIIQFYNKIIKNRFDIFYNIININNICFDHRYNIKLFPGYLYIHSNQYNNENNIYKSFFNELNVKEKKHFQLIIDIFNLGFTILNCNLKILNSNIKDCLNMNKKNEHKHNDKCCCLFHCIKNNNETFSCLFENINFSEKYFDFLHLITSFDIDNFKMEKIINHSWLNIDINDNINSKNNINELINLGKLYDFDNEYYTSISNIENFDLLCYSISKKLSDCEDYFSYFSIKNANMIFSTLDQENLSKELKVYEEDIENKLFKIYNTYFNNNFNTIN